MQIMNKVNIFIKSDEKFELLGTKLRENFEYKIKKLFYYNYGKKSIIKKPIRIKGRRYISIGCNVNILNGLRIEAVSVWNDILFNPHIIIGNNVSIGQNAHVISAEKLKIGNDVTISGNVFITDIDHDYMNINKNILKQDLIIRHTEIGDGCFIGYGAAIQAGTILGKHCIVGTNAVVRGKFDDYSVIVGVPAKTVKKFNIQNNTWEKINEQE